MWIGQFRCLRRSLETPFGVYTISERPSCLPCIRCAAGAGFLNAIDGLGAPDDVVLFMTTNHVERLDPAVLRPGRVDVRCEFRVLTKEMCYEPPANPVSIEETAISGARRQAALRTVFSLLRYRSHQL